jgi:hypothetical protein
MVDTKISVVSHKLCFFKLSSIICQDSLGHAESIYDALQKLDYCFMCYVHHWHSFYTLGECVDCDE